LFDVVSPVSDSEIAGADTLADVDLCVRDPFLPNLPKRAVPRAVLGRIGNGILESKKQSGRNS
jgi:hypothetical protein